MSALLKHARIVGQRLQILNNDQTELCVGRIDQAVILVWGENGRYEEHAALAGGYKLIAEPGELRGGGAIPPVCRQFADVNTLSGHILRNVGNGQNQIAWRIVLVEVDEVFQHGQRLMFRGVAEANAGTGPASTIAVGPFSVEWSAGVCLA